MVIGASAGGLDAVSTVLAQLPTEMAAAVFVVLHTPPEGGSGYVAALANASALPVRLARDEDTIYHGNVYVARPDHHLLLMSEHVRVARGPRENRSRPAIDPIFRSAALNYGARVIGVLMTGLLDDGVAGLGDIARAGGVTIVQDPNDAEADSMPREALRRVAVQHREPAHRIGTLIGRLVAEPIQGTEEGGVEHREVREVEVAVAAGQTISLDRQELLGKAAGLGCPECGGPLVEVADDSAKRYRCHIGHAYTSAALLADQGDQVERALSAAMRTLEERSRLLENLARSMSEASSAESFRIRSEEARNHAATIRRLVLAGAGEALGSPTPSD